MGAGSVSFCCWLSCDLEHSPGPERGGPSFLFQTVPGLLFLEEEYSALSNDPTSSKKNSNVEHFQRLDEGTDLFPLT
ncbi:unnamed protein product [Cuscuta campestris]|uniref:Uncharacterized protein n=1 Tax=Cuscuta campestris TaxID=132261 RepID=A0A484M8U2_9ASTE|nr:unnamed protein product [Cuscuta campestris]